MQNIAIVTDSNSGITQKQGEEMGIYVVPMPFFIDDTMFLEDITLDQKKFYEMLLNDRKISTSMPSPGDIMDLWKKLLKDHDSVVYIPMSSGLSASCSTALSLAEEFDGRVQVVDNQRISVTMRQSVIDAMNLREAGRTAEQIKEILEKEKFESSIYITLETLKYLKRGGRITPAAAAVGTLLRIKPVLQIKGERLDAFSKARTMNQGKNIMINAMKHDIETLYGGLDKENVWLYAVHGNVPEQFEEFAAEVRASFPGIKVYEDVLSLSVACHIGPGALAIACSKKIPFDN